MNYLRNLQEGVDKLAPLCYNSNRKGERVMRLMWLLAYLRMCGYSCTIVAVIAHTGEVIRVAPIRFYGILGTALYVQSFNYDGEFLVVYLE